MNTIRIIHNLPRSGGTIFAKSISAQKDVVLLSEIHPIGPEIRENMGVQPNWGDPLYQFQNWYNLLDINEYNEVKNSNLDFLSKIKFINKKIKNQKKTLIIRDWSFVDFFGRPYVKPSQKLSLIETLSNDFEINNIFLIRDPIEMFISCNQKLVFFQNNYSFDIFLDGYSAYLNKITYDKFIIFENFIQKPSQNLKKISKILNFEFDENFNQNLKNINITGDIEASKSININNRKNKYNLLSEEQKEQINKNIKYLEIKTKIDKLVKNNS